MPPIAPNRLLVEAAKSFVEKNIAAQFHEKQLDKLTALKLPALLKRKNPYLFKAKAIESAPDLVKRLLDAHLSSQEETLFGDFLEALAIHVCGHAFGGKKSATEGVDLEFDREGKRYLVSIKSGPNWGNSGQIKNMQANFDQARRILGRKASIEAVNGCCYGKDAKPHKGSYLKLCGQDFWELVTGIDDFYQQIVEPLGHQAKQRTDAFHMQYAAVINRFSADFIEHYCAPNGQIDWKRLLEFNSGRKTP